MRRPTFNELFGYGGVALILLGIGRLTAPEERIVYRCAEQCRCSKRPVITFTEAEQERDGHPTRQQRVDAYLRQVE